MEKTNEVVPTRSAELTQAAAAVVDRIKDLTKIPKRHLIEEAILNYLPEKYERKEVPDGGF